MPIPIPVVFSPLEPPRYVHQSPNHQYKLLPFDNVKPLIEHVPEFTGATPVNLASEADVCLGGPFSFMCILKTQSIDHWSRIFDFSLSADEDSITAGAIEQTEHLHFTIFHGKKPISVRVDNFFELEKEITLLSTASATGHMKVFKDGVLVGENREGLAPPRVHRPRLIVGGHFQHRSQAFHGSIRSVRVWDQEVSWPAPSPAPAPCGKAEAAAV
ncbi:unnamed protein product [Prorocentrum cordatum]|uniref:Uncharacterized protein n=1 Tax=Prorocentrum cordatum TaxID=2364126 RepID=A0ABN9RTN4_9DINO|nr:unnamed protein product [Polarella glacialis]